MGDLCWLGFRRSFDRSCRASSTPEGVSPSSFRVFRRRRAAASYGSAGRRRRLAPWGGRLALLRRTQPAPSGRLTAPPGTPTRGIGRFDLPRQQSALRRGRLALRGEPSALPSGRLALRGKGLALRGGPPAPQGHESPGQVEPSALARCRGTDRGQSFAPARGTEAEEVKQANFPGRKGTG